MNETPIQVELSRISRRIREAREQSGFTLQELATRSRVAASTIQKIETGQMTPSVAVLMKVARGLERRVSEFLHDDGPEQEVLHLRAGARKRFGSESTVLVERISGDLFDPALETWRVTLGPGLSSGGPISYDGEEVVFCERGHVVFQVGETEYHLAPGDSLHLKAAIPHSWRNEGAEPVRFLITGTLPHAFRALIQERVAEAR